MAFAAVAELAGRAGARVVASEVVGLVPEAALAGVDPADLLLPADTGDRFLERRLARALHLHVEAAGAGATTAVPDTRRVHQ